MVMQIWKFVLNLGDVGPNGVMLVDMPSQAETLSVQLQNGSPVLWARVHPAAEPVKRVIGVALTGKSENWLGDIHPFIDTVQFNGGAFVAHFFDLGEVPA
ncbi:hypothetical protein D3C84_1096880 [compost metagenome]